MNRRYHLGRYMAIATLAALLAIALTVLLKPSSPTNAAANWRYSQFISEVQSGQVERVNINADRSKALVTTQNGDQVTVNLPQDPELISTLTSNDVEIAVSNQVEENVFTEDFLYSALPLLIFILVLVGSLVGVAFWIWTIVDCATNESSEGSNKLVWILIILFTGWVGALIYFFARRPQRIEELGR